MNKKLNWGIVSAGRIAEQFCQDLQYTTNGIAYGVAARNLADAQAFAEKYHVEKAYQGYQAMFDDPAIDVIYVATPHNFHYQNVVDAISAGKHVLCEKPITISAKQCAELSVLAKEKNVFLMEAMWTYFLPAMQKAKQWVEQGRIGNIKHVKVDFGYPMPYQPEGRAYNPELAGGCLLDMGIYPIAINHFFLNQDLDELQVRAQLALTGVDDDVMITAKCGQAMSSLATSFQCRLGNSAHIIGDKGYIVIPDAFRAYQCSLFEMDDLVEHFQDDRQSIGLNFEAEEVGRLILAGNIESDVVSHQHSLLFQQQMERIKALF
ncbi:Gfo/Idh/MocA family protein [Thalassotalea sp. PLHSN55]|uniref:Gfo/Idh/MocA family protein n=1 Tax=Thalassotalea sp. PLHSN55 TaxID=3435888 RepID=UPI003F8441A8